MIQQIDLSGRVTHLWAMVCPSWGIHRIARYKRDLQNEEKGDWETSKKIFKNGVGNWCGPHRIVKLKPSRLLTER